MDMAQETDFERLVDVYYPSLYRFAFSLTRQESDACDLTQQTFFIWAKKGHQLQDAAKVKSWLFTTLHREYLQQRRRSKRYSDVNLDEAEHELPEVAPTRTSQTDAPTALQALARLDNLFQAPVALFYLEDYSYLEIAQILEIPLGTVKSRISRGISQLQQLLADSTAVMARKECS
jgi:RNA polymerase sigma-70 factor, ECF subfamily